jgi:hypothetical protein
MMTKERYYELIAQHPQFKDPGVPAPSRLDGEPPSITAPTFRWTIYNHRSRKKPPSHRWDVAAFEWSEETLKYRATVPIEDRFWTFKDAVTDINHAFAEAYRSAAMRTTKRIPGDTMYVPPYGVAAHLPPDHIVEIARIWLWEWNWPGVDRAQKMINDMRAYHYKPDHPNVKLATREFEKYIAAAKPA